MSAFALAAAVMLFKHIEATSSEGRAGAAREDYKEECQGEGCSSEELSEICASYTEECIGEGCSKEEVIELAGNPGSVFPMLQDLKAHGCKVRESDFGAGNCQGIKTDTQCAAVTLWCKDYYACPGGNFDTSWYICGGCIGFGSGSNQGGGSGCSVGAQARAAAIPASTGAGDHFTAAGRGPLVASRLVSPH
jgi:hypothetical protein